MVTKVQLRHDRIEEGLQGQLQYWLRGVDI